MSMINKIKYLILLLIFCANSAQSQEQLFNFKTKSIEVIDNGNIINAKNGKAISNDKNLEIIADNFQYLDKTKILRINGNAEIFINSNQLKEPCNMPGLGEQTQAPPPLLLAALRMVI